MGSVEGVEVGPQPHSWSVLRKADPRVAVAQVAARQISPSNSRSPDWFVETRVVVADGSEEEGVGCFLHGPNLGPRLIRGTTRWS